MALVAAVDLATAQAAARAVKVEARPLPGVYDAETTLDEGAEPAHPDGNLIETFQIHRGDVDVAFADADLVISHRYVAPPQEHA